MGSIVEDKSKKVDGLPYTATMVGAIEWLSRHQADNFMLIDDHQSATYKEASEKSRQLAKALVANGVGKGTRVAFLYPNGIDFAVTLLAISRVGAIAIPVNTFSTSRELVWQLKHCDAQMLITVDSFLQNDYIERLESGIPGWRAGQVTPIQDPAVPHLRRIVVQSREPNRSESDTLADFVASGADVSDDLLSAIESLVVPADWLCVLYTSGSSADPKGVVHTHSSIVRRAGSIGEMWGIAPGEVVYSPSPMFWTGGFITGLLMTFVKGGTLLCEERFDPARTLDNFEKHRVSIAIGWPHFAESLRAQPDFGERDLDALHGGNLAPVLKGFETPDPGLVATGIGMTESAAHHTYGQDAPLPESLRGAYGKPAPGVEHLIVDVDTGQPLADGQEGELCLRGYSVMQGYYKKEREEVFRRDGFFPTGDLGIIREGYYFFRGRKGDMVKTGGANVSPEEVRRVVLSIPGVRECFVSGLPDPGKGQIVAAAVVVDDGMQFDTEEFRRELKTSLSSFKVPRIIKFLSAAELPMLSTAKVDRRALMQMLAEQSNDT